MMLCNIDGEGNTGKQAKALHHLLHCGGPSSRCSAHNAWGSWRGGSSGGHPMPRLAVHEASIYARWRTNYIDLKLAILTTAGHEN
jgi:hypothetical protein